MSEQTAKLHDGREVDTCSEEWRAECEARHVLNMEDEFIVDDSGREIRISAKSRRHDYLNRVAAKRGRPSRDALADLVMAVWKSTRKTGQEAY